MVIVIAGMIGVGKTTLANAFAKKYGSKVFYENVEANMFLPLFYKLSDEEIQKQRIPFLTQLDFLNHRFKLIKQALTHPNNINDRSIYEDEYFCYVNMKLGRISEMEYDLYKRLLANMMEELKELPKKTPDVLIYLRADYDTILSRIKQRGRNYELDPKLETYYKTL